VVGDFNGEGKLDLALADPSSIYISILLGNGDGPFGPRTDFAVGPNPKRSRWGTSQDLIDRIHQYLEEINAAH
jgi:hypothetical protein